MKQAVAKATIFLDAEEGRARALPDPSGVEFERLTWDTAGRGLGSRTTPWWQNALPAPA